MYLKTFILINFIFNVSAISVRQPNFFKADLCNCSFSNWYVNQSFKLKKYLLKNKEALYM